MKYKKLFSGLILPLLIVITSTNLAFSQILDPVKWSFSVEKLKNNEANLVFKAVIDADWSLYAQDVPAGGPLPTEFHYNKSESFRLIGKASENPKPTIVYDETFEMNVGSWKNRVSFKQKVKVISSEDFKINGRILYMVCNEGSCIPLENDFSFNLKGAEVTEAIADDETDTAVEEDLSVEDDTLSTTDRGEQEAIVDSSEESKDEGKKRSLWAVFLTGILGGLLALLTPCVFPMIPLTVSFFLRNADNRVRAVRDALFYGFTIIFSYVVLGLAISVIFGADTLNAAATSVGFNIFFFALLIFFAASFFGAFELTMPAKWSTALDNKADKTGGLLGVILMGFTFVLVSFSCTGPIVGTLLVDAASGENIFNPAIGMLGFSLALAIPFSLFAVFPAALKSLPKSGGWMNSIKVVLGFLVLAFALKFLSIADIVGGWGILDREVFIVLWIAISLLLGLYLIGKIKFAHDSDLKYMSVPRLMFAIMAFSFVFYLLPGLWGAPLRAISSFLPSTMTQDFDLSRTIAQTKISDDSDIYVGESVKNIVHGLKTFTDYDEGMAAAKKAGKPVFLDFTGLACANCRKMEANVWPDPEVRRILYEDYVIISLYVDDRKPLPEEEQIEVELAGRKRILRTVGNKWSHFQSSLYGINSQPYYVLLHNNGNKLIEPMAYNTNINEYILWLESGLKAFYADK